MTAPTGRGSLGRLVPSGGGRDYALSKARVLIGRRTSCDVVLSYKTVSGKHCRLDLNDGYWHATDLDSHNGTWKNGVRCDKAWIYPHDRLSIATLHFSIDYSPYGEPPDSDFVPATEAIDKSPLLSKVGIREEDIEQILSDDDKRDDGQLRPRLDLNEKDDVDENVAWNKGLDE